MQKATAFCLGIRPGTLLNPGNYSPTAIYTDNKPRLKRGLLRDETAYRITNYRGR